MTHPHTIAAREAKASSALKIGINETTISALVENFYGRVRVDALLAPIFDARITEWDEHLGRMKEFWAAIALESGRFHGNPMMKHVTLQGVHAPEFHHWLKLFDQTLVEVFDDDRAIEYLRSRARRIANSLWAGIQVHRDDTLPQPLGIENAA